MGTGFLQIKATTAEEILPIANADVQIFDTGGKLLYRSNTDANGLTRNFCIPAPNESLTLDLNYQKPAYSVVDVTVSAPGYVTERIHGVKVVDTQTGSLPVAMRPLVDEPNPITYNDIYVPEIALLSEEPYMKQGDSITAKVLSEVVIPDYITVHLGEPLDTSARNIRVKFSDYIKNVASNEIYPTWPYNSLVANIHAITTFALNRVFTEWYRIRGYNFDITSSRDYDQLYVEGSTIFQNISQIVDEIFNVYAHRFGFRNPYFTQFCNGTTVTCPGLSQWGTVTLANQGKSPLEILRYYYTLDLELTESNNITGITESFPGNSLSVGSSGEPVRRMQNFLNRIRINYPLIPIIENPNGMFGNDTAEAVKVFQKTFNLDINGIIDRATWNEISFVFVGVTKLADLNSEGERISIGKNPPNVILSQGSQGQDVLELQFILNTLAFYYPEIPTVIQDSVFDARDTASVIEFQKIFGLTPDGIVGPITWDKLYAVYRGIKNNVVIPPVVPNYFKYTALPDYSLQIIAQKFDTTVNEVKTLNNFNSEMISMDQVLKTPNSVDSSPSFDYTVQPGDSLQTIAQKFGTTVNEIKTLNNLNSEMISVNQVLKIPNSVDSSPSFEYTVQPGDSLWIIAQKFGTKVNEIKTLNNLTNNVIIVGQVLKIPELKETSLPTNYFNYTVQRGDSLWLLAQRFSTTVEAIRTLNGLTSTILNIGQMLKIPQSGGATSISSPSSTFSKTTVNDAGHGAVDLEAIRKERFKKDSELHLALAVPQCPYGQKQ